MVGSLKKFSDEDQDIKHMQNLYNSGLKGQQHVYICFALAKVFEDLGDIEKEFGFLNEGNTYQKKLLNYDISHDKELFKKVRETAFIIRNNTSVVPMGKASPIPIFILGMPRSGTSLVEQIISSHSEITGAGDGQTQVRHRGDQSHPGGPPRCRT